jgi:hypothetical protein
MFDPSSNYSRFAEVTCMRFEISLHLSKLTPEREDTKKKEITYLGML